MKILLISSTLLLCVACATSSKKTALNNSKIQENSPSRSGVASLIDSYEKEKNTDVVKEPIENTASIEVVSANSLELEYHESYFNHWINYFTKESANKERFIRHLTNGYKFRPVINQILAQEGVPQDLFYVGLIESGFNESIKSSASAVGPWQFMKGTAVRYGLRVDRHVDERINIHKSTRAAAKYFKDLYNIFGSWELALCAYNAGEYRIINAIRAGQSRDYKVLIEKGLLPQETIYYVPKIAAAREIEQNSKRYKIPMIKADSAFYADTTMKKVKRNFSLEGVAKNLGASYAVMQQLNPDIRNSGVRVTTALPFELVIPSEFKNSSVGVESEVVFYTPEPVIDIDEESVEETAEAPVKMRAISSTNEPPQKFKRHTVRKGEKLSSLARRLGISVAEIKRLNKIKGNRLKVGQQLKLPRSQATAGSDEQVSEQDWYKVKRGEGLTSVARKFSVSVSKLKRMNNLKRSHVYVGEKLRVPASSVDEKRYRVKRGDTLSSISKKFNISQTKIKRANSMRSQNINAGQLLVIPF